LAPGQRLASAPIIDTEQRLSTTRAIAIVVRGIFLGPEARALSTWPLVTRATDVREEKEKCRRGANGKWKVVWPAGGREKTER
jgi:hypothetical protein